MVVIQVYSDNEAAEDAKTAGNKAFQRQDYGLAIQEYTSAIDLNCGTMHIFYSNRAACHIHIKNWQLAYEDASACIVLEPNFVKGHQRKIKAQIELGMDIDARESLLVARQIENLNARALMEMDQLDADISAVEEARRNPEQHDHGEDHVPMECSWDAGEMGFDMKRLGNEAFKGGLFDQAIEYYTEAVDRLEAEGMEDEVAIVRNNRAACFQQLGNHAKVIEDCSCTLEVLPGNVKALIRRGLAQEALEQYQGGFEDMSEALKLDPSQTMAIKARNRLQKLAKALQDEYIIVSPDSPTAMIGFGGLLDIDEITI